jgi:hypothetical protein
MYPTRTLTRTKWRALGFLHMIQGHHTNTCPPAVPPKAIAFPVLTEFSGAFMSEPAWRVSAKDQGFWVVEDLWQATFIVSKQMAVEYAQLA